MLIDSIEKKYSKFLDKFSVFEREDTIHVSLIVIKPEYRGQGIGRQIFNDLINMADTLNKIITLTPDSNWETSKAALINFYKSLGFVLNKGRNKDFTISDSMYRKPKMQIEETVMYNKNRFQKLAGILKEQHDIDPEKINVTNDDEGAMAIDQLQQMAYQANELMNCMPPDAQMEGWVQSKLTLASEMLDTVYHYLMVEDSNEEI